MTFERLFIDSPFSRLIENHLITYIDVGSRGGFERDLWPIAFGVDAIGFEPDPEEFARLEKRVPGPWRSERMLMIGLAGTQGKKSLCIPSDPEGASLLPPVENLRGSLRKPQFFDIKARAEVETAILDDVLVDEAISGPDYLKLDIEGCELEVLEASLRALANLLAIKVEVAHVALRQGQPLAHEIFLYLNEMGFTLIDLSEPARWRTFHHVIHPHMAPTTIPYSRGQVIHGDALFFREPDAYLGGAGRGTEGAIRLALIAMSFGYFDFAAEIFAEDSVSAVLTDVYGISDPIMAVDGVSRAYGRKVARREFFRHLRLTGPFPRRIRNVVP